LPRTKSRASYKAVAQRLARVAAHDEVARLRHEGRHVPDGPVHNDVDPLHRDTAAGTGIALDNQKPAMARGAGILARVAFHDHGAGHHVLGHARPDRPRHTDRRLLVHAAAVVTGGAPHGDVDRRVEANGDGVAALGVHDLPRLVRRGAGKLVQRRVQAAQAVGFDIVDGHVSGSRNRRSRARAPRRGRVDAGQVHQRAVFATESDVLLGFGHDGGLAGDGVAHHAEPVLGAHHEGEEPVEIAERAFQRLAQRRALLHPPCQVGRADLGVVLAFDADAVAAQLSPQRVVIGERPVVHEALVGPGGKRMRALGRHGGFGGHAGMADAMGARHGRQAKAVRDIAGQPHFLVDLDPVAIAHDAQALHLAQGGAGGGHALRFHVQDRMRVVPFEPHGRPEPGRKRFRQCGEDGVGRMPDCTVSFASPSVPAP
jgi:hypothetical protein